MGLKVRDGSGILTDAEGNKVSFTINTNSENTTRIDMATFIATDLRKIGMEVNTLPLAFNLLVQKIDVSFDWECIVFGLTGSRDPHWGSNVWKSSGRLHMWWPFQKSPGFDWEKREDEIFDTAISGNGQEQAQGHVSQMGGNRVSRAAVHLHDDYQAHRCDPPKVRQSFPFSIARDPGGVS